MPVTTQKRAKNVLVIYVDQWRWDALGSMGSQAHTPNLDKLASDGVQFDHAFVQSPVCMPSRVSMLTGRYPSNLGITHMGVPVDENTETVATTLRRRGWRTANIGKLHFLPHANRDHSATHPDYGFDTLQLSDEPGVYHDDYRAWVASVAPESLPAVTGELPPAAHTWRETMGETRTAEFGDRSARDDFAEVREFGADDNLTHTAWVASQTVDHLRSLSSEQPAFTIASFFSPHAPFCVPRRFLDLYDAQSLSLPALTDQDRQRQAVDGPSDAHLRTMRHGYYAAISEVDWHIGRILDVLDELGRSDDTLVVFVADHGEWMGDNLRFSKGYPADDPVSRVPLIMRWPEGTHEAGRVVTDIVECVDIVPTVLDAVGVPAPRHLQGASLRGYLDGSGEKVNALGITEHDGWRSIRVENHRYLVHSDGTETLWEVSLDGLELRDVTTDPAAAETLSDIRRRYIAHVLRSERPRERTWAY